MLRITALGEPGRAWVRQCLGGGKPLSRSVLGRMDIDGGSVLALGISGRTPESIGNVEYPLSDPPPLPRDVSAESLFILLAELLGLEGGYLLIVEDDVASPNDPWLLRLPSDATTICSDDIVYHLRYLSDVHTGDDLARFLSYAYSGAWLLNGFVLKAMHREEVSKALRTGHFELVADHVEAIINSVFDNDLYSIWVPNRILEPLLHRVEGSPFSCPPRV